MGRRYKKFSAQSCDGVILKWKKRLADLTAFPCGPTDTIFLPNLDLIRQSL
jgi:hypothetical protein